jgi:ubiquinone/menaquinone biosynthesis C-methylase UbiE
MKMPAEFDGYAQGGYSRLLEDPLRGKFARPAFFFERKLAMIRELYRLHGMKTESVSWLDVGCGEGELLRTGRQYFREIAGCDVSAGMMQNCNELNVRLQDSARRIPFEDKSFDLITAVCVYHHVDIADRPALTADIYRVLKPNGLFCVIEHNPLNILTRLIVWRSPIDVHAHLLTAGTVRRLAGSARMAVLATRYFLYFPERLYFRLATLEAKLSAIPMGGQYAVFCQKV